MNNSYLLTLFIIFLVNIDFLKSRHRSGPNNKNRFPAKLEKSYMFCSGENVKINSYTKDLNKDKVCYNRIYDYSCIYMCMSEYCYNLVYNNTFLEFGQIEYDKQLEFEKCFLSKNNQNH